MSEKRFKLLSGGFDEEGNPLYLIKDTTDMIGDYEICKKVIEQQATIEEQNKEIEESSAFIIEQRKENKRLNDENVQLRHELKEKQEEEHLYTNEIVKLNKEVKDNQFLKLGNDY